MITLPVTLLWMGLAAYAILDGMALNGPVAWVFTAASFYLLLVSAVQQLLDRVD